MMFSVLKKGLHFSKIPLISALELRPEHQEDVTGETKWSRTLTCLVSWSQAWQRVRAMREFLGHSSTAKVPGAYRTNGPGCPKGLPWALCQRGSVQCFGPVCRGLTQVHVGKFPFWSWEIRDFHLLSAFSCGWDTKVLVRWSRKRWLTSLKSKTSG